MQRLFLFGFLLLVSVITPGCGTSSTDPGAVDTTFGSPSDAKSSDLDADIRMMWSVEAPEPGEKWVKATDDAIHASSRVFNTVKLEGLTRTQVMRKLRFDLRSKKYGYDFPFYPVRKGVLPVRIDNGNYGWQFNIYFDERQRVEVVRKQGIE